MAFAGRSNVGKSSLVNALAGRAGLARTSRTPGRTQELIFFDLHGSAALVDMPGYGYAAASKEKAAAWGELARDYLRGRPTLLRVFVLIDGRHGLKESDQETMRVLDRRRLLRHCADEGRRSEGQRQKRADRGDARGPPQACRRLPRGHVHVGPHRRRGRGFARPHRPPPRGAAR